MLPEDSNSGTERSKFLPRINWEAILQKHAIPIALGLFGLILVGLGAFYTIRPQNDSNIEIIEADQGQGDRELIIEVSGEVENPGVYKLAYGSRIEDALSSAGGLTPDANTDWIEKTINRAAKIKDGQKIFIPSIDQQSDVLSATESGLDQSGSSDISSNSGKLININTSSGKELESMWEIGPVYAQNIIDQRPYSNVEELLTRKILKQNVYDRNKDLITVY